jgi:L-seryl-tRNA(Ser) seleniumtransferase
MPETSDPRPPSVDALARSLGDTGLAPPVLIDIARRAIAEDRWTEARDEAEAVARTGLQRVVNGTGVLLHTNLGRAPWGTHLDAGAMNLEFDLDTGRRGHRDDAVAARLARLCGAEASTIVNNGAAAVLLALAGVVGDSGGVAVSRGELVEIGGGFRIPEVMARSGARLVEVGTTNRTRVDDYRRAVDAGEASAVMVVHRSNFSMSGFVDSPTPEELSRLGVPLVVDLGSGLVDTRCGWLDHAPPTWLASEPGVVQCLDAGADLVIFSGDKLLGGPQAGLIVGRADLVESCRSHPLARALRCGGLVLASLDDLIDRYLRRDGGSIPFWRMATTTPDELRARALSIVAQAGSPVEIVECAAVTGGGTLPGVEIASVGIAVPGDRLAELRRHAPPVIGRLDGDLTLIDLRGVEPADDATVAAALAALDRTPRDP